MSTRQVPRSYSAKQNLRSSRGFGNRPSRPNTRAGTLQVDRSENTVTEVRVGPTQQEVQCVETEAPRHREICSICLEGLDDYSFSYPCGQGHLLHYGCMIHFLANVLSLALTDGSPGPLLKEQVRDLGNGFKAIALLEGDGVSTGVKVSIDTHSGFS